MLSSYTAPDAKSQVNSIEDAEKEKMVADMSYDLVLLKKEQRAWSTYLTQHRLFNAETHNAKVEEREAIALVSQKRCCTPLLPCEQPATPEARARAKAS